MSSDQDALRSEIQKKWSAEIGEAVHKGDIEMAQKMSQLTGQVVDFVISCKDILRNASVPQPSVQPNPFEDRLVPLPPSNEPVPPPTPSTYSLKEVDQTINTSAKRENFSLALKKQLSFAKIIPGTNDLVNNDRLLMVFGRCWPEVAGLSVTRAIMTTNHAEARQNFSKVTLPRLKAVCILPDPNWLCSQKIWDVFDDFQQLIANLQEQQPTLKIILATLPIDAGTDFDPAFFQFNDQIMRNYNNVHDNLSVIRTASLFSTERDIRRGLRKHLLSEESAVNLFKELDRHLSVLGTSRFSNAGKGAR